jgi:6-phosphogluconolactonase
MSPPIIRAFPDTTQLIRAAADFVAGAITDALAARGRAWVVLSGGETPRALYERLAEGHSAPLPWDQLWWCFGDDRWVPHDDPLSNVAMVNTALFARARVATERIVAVPTDARTPSAGARAYERLLRAHFPDAAWPEFDVVLMGLGSDGHTASLFPGDRALEERAAWVTTSRAGQPVPDRVTLTIPVFSHARTMLFLVAGASKAEALAATLTGPPDPRRWPAQAAAPVAGRCLWLVDRAAAHKLPAGMLRP